MSSAKRKRARFSRYSKKKEWTIIITKVITGLGGCGLFLLGGVFEEESAMSSMKSQKENDLEVNEYSH